MNSKRDAEIQRQLDSERSKPSLPPPEEGGVEARFSAAGEDGEKTSDRLRSASGDNEDPNTRIYRAVYVALEDEFLPPLDEGVLARLQSRIAETQNVRFHALEVVAAAVLLLAVLWTSGPALFSTVAVLAAKSGLGSGSGVVFTALAAALSLTAVDRVLRQRSRQSG